MEDVTPEKNCNFLSCFAGRAQSESSWLEAKEEDRQAQKIVLAIVRKFTGSQN